MKPQKHQAEFDVFPSYRGGHTTFYVNYVWEFCPGHHLQNAWGWVAQYRLIAEEIVGRHLLPGEHVHHKDENKLNNNPENLEILTMEQHRSFHAKKMGMATKKSLTETQVRETLEKEGGIRPAARALRCSHTTLRGRFPELTKPYQRISPTNINNPRDIETVLQCASDPSVSLQDAGKIAHMCPSTVKRICQRRGIVWMRKKDSHKVPHTTYVRKKPILRHPVPQNVVEAVLSAATDPTVSQRDLERTLHIAGKTIARVCSENNVTWMDSRVRKTYLGKTTKTWLKWSAEHSESVPPPSFRRKKHVTDPPLEYRLV